VQDGARAVLGRVGRVNVCPRLRRGRRRAVVGAISPADRRV